MRGRKTMARLLAWMMVMPAGFAPTALAVAPRDRAVLWSPLPVNPRLLPAAGGARAITSLPTTPRVAVSRSVVSRLGATAPAVPALAASTDPFIDPCLTPVNEIVAENCLPGSPAAEWDLTLPDGGDPTIQGFTTEFSVNTGASVHFKIDTDATAYRLDIYRMGYYGGLGARYITTVLPSAPLPQHQQECLTDEATGLIDCGNWQLSASWQMPAGTVSGIYFAKAVRLESDGSDGGSSHIFFVVRDDAGGSDLLFQTSDTTWQAYNAYGGNSLYTGEPVGRAYKVSYNRPFVTRGGSLGAHMSWVFSAEYPMVRWLEGNGYDVSYFSGIDADRFADADLVTTDNIVNPVSPSRHKVFLSVGHDEYWSGRQRANVEAARDAGMHLAFFSGNEVFWKTRWENSISPGGAPYRTLVSYKETHGVEKIDPEPDVWTGTWRDAREFNPEGARPENALTGTLFMVNGPRQDAIMVPAEFGAHRFWRNTSIATLQPGQTAILPLGTLGYEWNVDADNGFRPAGLQRLSSTTIDVSPLFLLDEGSSYGNGTATHNLTLYRAPSNAYVFSAGTVQWSWGLDTEHDNALTGANAQQPSLEMRQATVNLFADMGVSPGRAQPGILSEPPGSEPDSQPPTSTILSPPAGSLIENGDPVIITGTATDVGGIVAGVEVSVDDGVTWSPAASTWRPEQNLADWTFTWVPSGQRQVTIKSRATDDAGNVQEPPTSVSVTVVCPCSLWDDAAVPAVKADPDSTPVELGVRFAADVSGFVTGIRFYKGLSNTGTHVGRLWEFDAATSTWVARATATFGAETAQGWQQVLFDVPVAIAAGTIYVASYSAPNGHFALTRPAFETAVVNSPLSAPADSPTARNGVFSLTLGSFPAQAPSTPTNYWVDVVFVPGTVVDTGAPFVTIKSPRENAIGVSPFVNVSARFSEAIDAASLSGAFELRDSSGLVPAAVTYDGVTRTATLDPLLRLADGTRYTVTLTGGAAGVRDLSGNWLISDVTWSFTTSDPAGCPCTIWTPETVPSFLINNAADAQAVELGVKFRTDIDGYITGVRYYKSAANTGEHTGTLWNAQGIELATAVFIGESSTGWQEVTFSSPVRVLANQTYVASYHTNVGRYSVNRTYFLPELAATYTRAPLRALADGDAGPNGVYVYGGHAFPTQSALQSNYWVDVVFTADPGPDADPPTVVFTTPLAGSMNIRTTTTVTARFSEGIAPSTLTASTFELRSAAGVVPAAPSYDPLSLTATLTPTAALAYGTLYTARLIGGTNPIRDLANNPLADVSWSFTTETAPGICPCTIWSPSTGPAGAASADAQPVELGVKFRAARAGFITGIRFYKDAANTGPHTGTLWDAAGNQLAVADFAAETPSGWQEVRFANPVSIAADQTYVASYHTTVGRYHLDRPYFVLDPIAGDAAFNRPPLRALADGVDGGNGVFRYGPRAFPLDSSQQSNYWVDVVFEDTATDVTPPLVVATTPANGAIDAAALTNVTARFSEAIAPATLTPGNIELRQSGNLVPAALTYDAATRTATLDPADPLIEGATYVATVRGGLSGIADLAGNPLADDVVWSFAIAARVPCERCTIFTAATGPALPDTTFDKNDGDVTALGIELGVKFRSDVGGYIRGIRFYKHELNTGEHTATLWSVAGGVGTELATATFVNETASGWQEVRFAQRVPILANTTYVATYHTTNGHYTVNRPYFTAASAASFTNPPLRATVDAPGDGNGVFLYGAHGFPVQSAGGNYWVDVVFDEREHTPPLAGDDQFPATAGQPLSVAAPGVLGNDTDGDSDALTAVLDTGVTYGTLTLNADGSFVYVPGAGFTGTDSFTYRADDGRDVSLRATVTIQVAAGAPPVVANVPVSTLEDVAVAIVLQTTPPDASATFEIVTPPQHGQLTLSLPNVTYTPQADYYGPDAFTYRALNGAGSSNTGTVAVEVVAMNDAPSAGGDLRSTPEDTPLELAAGTLLANDTAGPANESSQVLVVTAVTAGAETHGTVSLTAGVVRYVPATDFSGLARFAYTVCDDGTSNGAPAPLCTEGIVEFSVGLVNDPPVANDDSASTPEDTAVGGNVLTNDTDVDSATVTAAKLTDPANGVATVAADGTFTYTPASNFNGTDSFTYRATDGAADSNTATVTITVTPANDAPTVATPIADVTVDEDAANTVVTLAPTFADAEGSASLTLTVAGNTNPALVGATLAGTTLTLDYAANASGTATITVRATDAGGLSVEDSFTVTVTAVNDLPTISDVTDRTIDQNTTTGALAFTVGDLETPAGSLTPSGASSNTTLVPNGNIVFGGSGSSRTVTVTPAAGQSGSSTLTITITDANGGSALDTFALTVNAIASTATTTPTTSQPSTTYGTSVTFTSIVTVTPGGAPVTTGAVTFYDNGVPLGSANVNASGVASLATTMVEVGTRTITAAYAGTASFAPSTSPGSVTQTVAKATAASTLTVAPLAQQYSDNEVFEVTVTGANGGAPAQGVTFRIGTQTMNSTPVAFVSQGGGVWKARATLPLLESGTAGQLRPNATPKIVGATLNTVSPNYTLSNPSSKSLTINKEDARVAYTGPSAVSTGGATGTTIPLRATVSDISSTPDANGDTTPGDLRLAQVQFINRGTGLVIATVAADAAGVATYNWPVDIAANASQAYTVGFIVTNYYNRNNAADNAVITVSK